MQLPHKGNEKYKQVVYDPTERTVLQKNEYDLKNFLKYSDDKSKKVYIKLACCGYDKDLDGLIMSDLLQYNLKIDQEAKKKKNDLLNPKKVVKIKDHLVKKVKMGDIFKKRSRAIRKAKKAKDEFQTKIDELALGIRGELIFKSKMDEMKEKYKHIMEKQDSGNFRYQSMMISSLAELEVEKFTKLEAGNVDKKEMTNIENRIKGITMSMA